MSVKTCFKCGSAKPLAEFYRHPMMADGHLGKCKDCTKSDVRRNRDKNIDYYRTYDSERGNRQTPEDRRDVYARNKAKILAANRAAYRREPLKRAARIAFGNALARGKIARGACEICGSTNAQGHHDDYGKPMDVHWLCPKHHGLVHKLMRWREKCAAAGVL